MKSNIRIAFEKCKNEKRPALLLIRLLVIILKKIIRNFKCNCKLCRYFEVGIPHNTPIADGGQIQSSAYRAIKNGIKIKNIFQIVKQFKKNKNPKPVILMGYYNNIYQQGENTFLRECKKSGVDGIDCS